MKISKKLLIALLSLCIILSATTTGCSLLKRSTAPPELKGKPLPELKSTVNNYTREQVDRKFQNLEVSSRFAQAYTAGEGPRVTKPLVDYLLKEARAKKEDPEELKKCLKIVMPEGTKSVAIPCYVEKAKFEDKDVWIVIQNWGMPGEKLAHTRTWVVAPKNLQILYASSSK